VLVDDRGADGRGRHVGPAGQPGRAGLGLEHQILPGAFAVGAGRAVAGAGAVHESGIRPLHRLVAKAETVKNAGPVILHQDVGGPDQPPEDVLAPVGFEIHRDAALVTVGQEEEDALAVQKRLGPRPVSLPRATRRLDLHHIGAEVGQKLHTRGTLEKMRQADDP
jgi:hypothetical protein